MRMRSGILAAVALLLGLGLAGDERRPRRGASGRRSPRPRRQRSTCRSPAGHSWSPRSGSSSSLATSRSTGVGRIAARRDPLRRGARPRAARIVRRPRLLGRRGQRASSCSAVLAVAAAAVLAAAPDDPAAAPPAERRRRPSQRSPQSGSWSSACARSARCAPPPAAAAGRARPAPQHVHELARRLLGRRARDGRPGAAPRRRARGATSVRGIRERPALLYVQGRAQRLPRDARRARTGRAGPAGCGSRDPAARRSGGRSETRRGPGSTGRLRRAPRSTSCSTGTCEIPAVTLCTVLLGVVLVRLAGSGASAELRGVARAADSRAGRRPRRSWRRSRTPATAPRRTRTRRSTAATRPPHAGLPSARGGSCRGRPSRGAFSERRSWPPVV